MLSNQNHIPDKPTPIKPVLGSDQRTANGKIRPQFGFVLERKTQPLLEELNTEMLSKTMAQLGPQSTRTSLDFSQVHD